MGPTESGLSSSESSSDEMDVEDDKPSVTYSRELRRALKGLPTPDTMGNCSVGDTINTLVRVLQRWSNDPQMTMNLREKAVRALYAIWHPDKNAGKECCTKIFQAMQQEVRRLCDLKKRLQQRYAEVNATREEKRAQKHVLKRRRSVPNEPTASSSSNEGPWPRSHCAMVVNKEELTLFGGEWFDGKTYHCYGELFTFRQGEWTKLYTAGPGSIGPDPRSGHCMCNVGSALYLFGGEYTSKDQRRFKQYGDLWRYENERWLSVEAKDGPNPRSGHRACAVGPMIFVFGGFTERVGFPLRYHNDLFVFDTQAGAWKKDRRKGTRPEPRSASCMWAGSNCFYLYGGSRPGKNQSLHIFDDLWRFTEEGWEGPFSTGGPKRNGMCVSALSHDKAFFFGGVTDNLDSRTTSSTFFGDIFLLEIQTPSQGIVTWTRIDIRSGPCGRFAAQCAVLNEAFWVFGGSCEQEKEEHTLDDLWRFDFQSRKWENVVPLSERAGVWYEEEEEEKPEIAAPPVTGCTTVSLVCDIDPRNLSKKERAKWEKRSRMEVKKVKMDEKEQKKLEKKAIQKQNTPSN